MLAESVKVVCSWCKETVREPKDWTKVSHGVCQPCLSKVAPAFALQVRREIDGYYVDLGGDG